MQITIDDVLHILDKKTNGGCTSKCGTYVIAETGERVFIKFFLKRGIHLSEIKKEVCILEQVKDIDGGEKYFPQIKSFGEFDYEEFQYFIVFELCKGRELFGCKTSPQQKEHIFSEMCKAIELLHKNNIVHCDLKLENVIYHKRTGEIKIVDFGGSNINGTCLKNLKIFTTPYIAPPEYMNYLTDTSVEFCVIPSFDIWSLGKCYFKLYALPCETFVELPRSKIIHENFLCDAHLRKMKID